MNSKDIRIYQRTLLAEFVGRQDYHNKYVLDFGCGNAPYREIVGEGGGTWIGFNRAEYPGGPKIDVGLDPWVSEDCDEFLRWDVILCTQMLQYVPDPVLLLRRFHESLQDDGRLILTYATNWPEVEVEDMWRFTKSGMERLMSDWKIIEHQRIGTLPFGDELLPFGYGLVATR